MTEGAPARPTWTVWALCVLALVAASFAPALLALRGAFVFDDARFIVDNPNVQETPSVLALFTDGRTIDPVAPAGIVRPLRTLDFVIDRALFGDSTLGFHLHSVTWHALTAVLLFEVLRRLVGGVRGPLVGALAFAVHPAHVEAVAWISSRGDVAVGATVTASVLCALRSKGRDAWFAASLVLAAVATLYKEVAVALPLAIFALRRLRFVGVPAWPYAVVAAGYVIYRAIVLPGGTHGVTFTLGGSVVGTFATMVRGFGFYVADTVLPTTAPDWYMAPSTTFADGAVVFWLLVHAALGVSAWRLRHRAPLVTLSLAWFVAFLLPVANWPVFLQIPTADRFLYLPLAGAAVALAVAARRVQVCPMLVAIGMMAGTSVHASSAWRDDETLWRRAVAVTGSPRGHAYLGNEIRKRALELRAKAFALPEGPEREKRLLATAPVLEESLRHLHAALTAWYAFELSDRSRGNVAREAEVNAANVCYLLGRDAEALFHADAAIDDGADDTPQPWYTRGLALLDLGYAPQAMQAMRQAQRLGFGGKDREIAEFYVRAGTACAADSMPSAAVAGYEAAAEIAPDDALRAHALSLLAAEKERPRPADAAARERQRLTALESALSVRLRPCPAPRGPARSNSR